MPPSSDPLDCLCLSGGPFWHSYMNPEKYFDKCHKKLHQCPWWDSHTVRVETRKCWEFQRTERNYNWYVRCLGLAKSLLLSMSLCVWWGVVVLNCPQLLDEWSWTFKPIFKNWSIMTAAITASDVFYFVQTAWDLTVLYLWLRKN